MNELNKDMIVYIALKMGLPEITALCQTNSKFNNFIGKNSIFWMNRLIQDYQIYNIPDVFLRQKKIYYHHILAWSQYPKTCLEHGVRYKDLNHIRIALDKGANIHTGNEYALREAIRLNHSKVVKYLIDKGADIQRILMI